MFLLMFFLFLLFVGLSLIGRLFGGRRRRMYDAGMMPPMFGRRYGRWGFGRPLIFEEERRYGHHHHHRHHRKF